MSWRKVFRRGLTVIFILASLLTAVVVAAAIQIFDGTGQYIIHDDADKEFHEFAKQRAQQRAELDAQKKAGVYLTSFSRSVNANLTNDEISVVTNNIIKVSDVKIVPVSFETDGEAGLKYVATLKASIDPEGIYDFIKRDNKEKVTIVQQNNSLQDAIAKNDALIEDLKEQYKRATSQAEKDRIINQMKQTDRDFLANQKLEEGLKLSYQGKVREAIKLYNDAIELNQNFAEVYLARGNIYRTSLELKNNELALFDYNKAIELKPYNSFSYIERALLYTFNIRNNELATCDYNKAIELEPYNVFNYGRRASFYANILRNNELALADINKVIELEPTVYNYERRADFYKRCLKNYELALEDYNKIIELEPVANNYILRSGFYRRVLNNYELAISDVSKAIELEPTNSMHYQLRGRIYQEMNETEKAQADFAKAKELGYKG